jgi:hypothetical protein
MVDIERGYVYKRPNNSKIIVIKHLGGKNQLYLCEEYTSNDDFLGTIKVPKEIILSYDPCGFDESAAFNRKG